MVKYVCSPKTGRVIQVDTSRADSTYESLRKSSRWKRKLARSPESSSKEKLKPCKSPKRKSKRGKSKRKSTKRRSRTPVECGGTEGWADKHLPDGTEKRGDAPTSHERTVMLRDCGNKCFLGHKKTFPICTRGTCSYNQKGISAACMRARQMSSPKSKKVKNRTKTYYNRIAQRALDLRNAQLKSSRGGGDHRGHHRDKDRLDDSHGRGMRGGGDPRDRYSGYSSIYGYNPSKDWKKQNPTSHCMNTTAQIIKEAPEDEDHRRLIEVMQNEVCEGAVAFREEQDRLYKEWEKNELPKLPYWQQILSYRIRPGANVKNHHETRNLGGGVPDAAEDEIHGVKVVGATDDLGGR